MQRLNINTTRRAELVDITALLEAALQKSGIKDGVCLLFVPHTTAGLTINENADPAVKSDIMNALDSIVPWRGPYAHMEGNADSHIKSSLFGSSQQVFIESGRLLLGRWQGVFVVESDGPRQRQVWVKFLTSKD